MINVHKKRFNLWMCVPAVLALAIGLVGVTSFAAHAAANTTVQVTVEDSAPKILFDVASPTDGQSGGNTYDAVFEGQNVSTVDVYLDGASTPFTAITVNSSTSFGPQNFGQLILPSGTALGNHTLRFVAHPKDDADTLSDITVERDIVVSAQAPRIDTVNPLTVPTTGGDEITIIGDNFNGATDVTIDGQPCTNFKVVSNTEIKCTVPSHAAGYVSVAVTTPQGTYTKLRALLYVVPSPLPMLPPETGLFRVGNHIVTTYEVFYVAGSAALIVLVVVLLVKKRYTGHSK